VAPEVRAALQDVHGLDRRQHPQRGEVAPVAVTGRQRRETLLRAIPVGQQLPRRAVDRQHAILRDHARERALAIGERPERVHQMGSAVTMIDLTVSPAKSASYLRSSSQRPICREMSEIVLQRS
jgi:hypothetical protein